MTPLPPCSSSAILCSPLQRNTLEALPSLIVFNSSLLIILLEPPGFSFPPVHLIKATIYLHFITESSVLNLIDLSFTFDKINYSLLFETLSSGLYTLLVFLLSPEISLVFLTPAICFSPHHFLGDPIHSHNFKCHLYADNSHINYLA